MVKRSLIHEDFWWLWPRTSLLRQRACHARRLALDRRCSAIPAIRTAPVCDHSVWSPALSWLHRSEVRPMWQILARCLPLRFRGGRRERGSMIDHAAHINSLIKTQLKTVSLGNLGVGFVVSHGYAPVPVPGNPDQKTLGPAWIITVTAKSALIGYPDIVLEAVLPGILPPDEHFQIGRAHV